jgi:hypothetical protein
MISVDTRNCVVGRGERDHARRLSPSQPPEEESLRDSFDQVISLLAVGKTKEPSELRRLPASTTTWTKEGGASFAGSGASLGRLARRAPRRS